MQTEIIKPLLLWYDSHARALPWRENTTPYRVWVSEIMLQQTRVEAARPYYARFMEELPTVEQLAVVDEQRLLKLWEGLGYYNRVKNMQKTALILMERYHGKFPCTYEEVVRLPGVGAYTAGAILSICYGLSIPAVDGNVLRLLARVTENWGDIGLHTTKIAITEEVRGLFPVERAGDLNQALIELGALVCVSGTNPKCEACPLSPFCLAYARGTQGELPVKAGKKPRQREKKTIFLLRWNQRIAIQRRPSKGLLGGLWELPNVEGHLDHGEAEAQLVRWGLPFSKLEAGISRKHIFTHREWEMCSYEANCTCGSMPFQWVSKEALREEFALPTAFQMFLQKWK